MSNFKVQKRQCDTCIYRPGCALDIKKLEAQVADRFGGFEKYRICHHSKNVCCRGFWNRHKDKFALGQIAQRLGFVEFVEVDTLDKRKADTVRMVRPRTGQESRRAQAVRRVPLRNVRAESRPDDRSADNDRIGENHV